VLALSLWTRLAGRALEALRLVAARSVEGWGHLVRWTRMPMIYSHGACSGCVRAVGMGAEGAGAVQGIAIDGVRQAADRLSSCAAAAHAEGPMRRCSGVWAGTGTGCRLLRRGYCVAATASRLRAQAKRIEPAAQTRQADCSR
jgi:hypothetical protein